MKTDFLKLELPQPSDYVDVKTQLSDNFEIIDTAVKTANDNANAKLPLAGGTLTGKLIIATVSPTIELVETDSPTNNKALLALDGEGGRLQRDSVTGLGVFQWGKTTATFFGNATGNLSTSGGNLTGSLGFFGGTLNAYNGAHNMTLMGNTRSFLSSPQDTHLCQNSFWDNSSWKKHNNSTKSGTLVCANGDLMFDSSQEGETNPRIRNVFRVNSAGNVTANGYVTANGIGSFEGTRISSNSVNLASGNGVLHASGNNIGFANAPTTRFNLSVDNVSGNVNVFGNIEVSTNASDCTSAMNNSAVKIGVIAPVNTSSYISGIRVQAMTATHGYILKSSFGQLKDGGGNYGLATITTLLEDGTVKNWFFNPDTGEFNSAGGVTANGNVTATGTGTFAGTSITNNTVRLNSGNGVLHSSGNTMGFIDNTMTNWNLSVSNATGDVDVRGKLTSRGIPVMITITSTVVWSGSSSDFNFTLPSGRTFGNIFAISVLGCASATLFNFSDSIIGYDNGQNDDTVVYFQQVNNNTGRFYVTGTSLAQQFPGFKSVTVLYY